MAADVASRENVEITVAQKAEVAPGAWSTVYRAEISLGNKTIDIKQVMETKQYRVLFLEMCLIKASRDGNST